MSASSETPYNVVEAYIPHHDGEIELDVGDSISNVKDLQNGWTLGRNVTKEIVGIFPSGHIIPESLFWPSPPTNCEDPLDVLENVNLGNNFNDSTQDIRNQKPPGNHSHTTPHAPRGADKGLVESPTGSHTYEELKGRAGDRVKRSRSKDKQVKDDYEDQELLPYSDQEEYYTGSLPSPKKGGHYQQKPHMMVRPNASKNMYRQHPDTAVKSPTSDSEVQNSPKWLKPRKSGVGPGHSSASSSFLSTPPPQRSQRDSVSPGQLPEIYCTNATSNGPLGPTEEPAQIPSADPPQVTHVPRTSMGTPTVDEPNTVTAHVTENPLEAHTSITSTDRENTTNEYLTTDSPSPQESIEEVKRRYYRDYRTLECPPMEPKTPPMNKKFKPILKGTGEGRGREIHYRQENDHNQGNSMRLVISVLAGLIMGFILFLWMYRALGYPFMIAVVVSISMGVLLVLFFSISKLCRCTAALLFPSMCTTRGRIAFLILISGFLLDGPITNIYHNMQEVSRSMSCSAEQSYNQSMLLLQPFDAMMAQLNHTVTRLQVAATDVGQAMAPLQNDLARVEMDLYNGHLELTGTALTCRNMVDQAFNDCTSGIRGAMNQCLGVIDDLGTVYVQAKDVLDRINPERWAPKQHLHKRQIINANTGQMEDRPETDRDICEPLDTTLVCQSLNDSDILCQPAGWAGEAIQDAINFTKDAMRQLEYTLYFDVNPEPYFNARVNSTKIVYQIRKQVQKAFDKRTVYFEKVTDIMKKVIPVGILLLVYVAYLHVKNYVSKDTYDNVYITNQFKSLDQKRCEVAGESLLPLKKYERNYLIDTTISDLSSPEEGLYSIGLCVLVLHITISVVCYLFDYFLYWILALVRTHGDPDYDITGQESLQLILDGNGVITELLTIFLKGFHPVNLFGYTLDTQYCLPNPHPPSIIILLVIFLLYFTLLMMVLFKAYILRMRNRITAYFYSDREKARIVHLYNVVLNHRCRMPKVLQQCAKMNYREKQICESVSVCHQLAKKLPPCQVFTYGSVKCLVCGCKEDPTFRDCQTERCPGMYCAECYENLALICPLCLQSPEYDEEEEYEELEDDLTPYCRSSKIYV